MKEAAGEANMTVITIVLRVWKKIEKLNEKRSSFLGLFLISLVLIQIKISMC